jgi:hypothetical protein
MREALKAMTYDTYEVLDHVLPAHAVDWRRKFAGIERNLDALEAAGKCKSVPHIVTDDEWDVYSLKKPGDQVMVCSICGMEHGLMSNFCQWCGCEIEATE